VADVLYFKVQDTITPALRRLIARIPEQVADALAVEARIETDEARRRTPVDTGTLEASGHVEGPVVRQGGVEVAIVFGGAASAYAIYVHENLEAFHPHGEAKFLERTLTESAPYLADRVARRIDLRRAVT